MKKRPICCAATVLVAAACSSAFAQTNAPRALTLAAPEKSTPNRFGFAWRGGFNISADFKNLGSGLASNPGAAVGGVPHTYDDGFVGVDISGNAGNQTWNWGYQSAQQLAGPNLLMSSSQAGSIHDGAEDGAQHGFEFTYSRRLASAKAIQFGVESALNYTSLALRDNSVAGTVTMDAFALGGIIPPLAPYSGNFAGPGPLISDTPTRVPVGVNSRFDANVYGLRLGPYLEVPLGRKAGLTLSGGLAAAAVQGDYRFTQSAQVPGSGTISLAGRNETTRFHAGAYLGGTLFYKLGRDLSLFGGAQYQNLGHQSQTAGDKQVILNLAESIFATAGISYSF